MKKLTLLLACFFISIEFVFAQNKQVSGTVIDEAGDPVIGASVIVKGNASIGTNTDVDGKFTLNIPTSATTLVVKFLGMKEQEVAVASNMAITLQASTSILDEVVIVSYGSGRNAGTNIGSLQQVNSEKLKAKPVANVLDALQGQVAGLQVYNSSGEPGTTPSLRLHGVGSLGASSTPLYIVDGIQMNSGTVISMNPNDFESITVLKDASATSIYGSRAANGVVVITTKRGLRSGDTKITVRSQYGISKLAEKGFYNFMNTDEYLNFWTDMAQGMTQAAADKIRTDYPNINTNWIDVYMRDNTPTRQSDVSIQGGGGKTTYFLSGSQFSQEGTAWGSFFNRLTVRANVESEAKSWLKVGMNVMVGQDKRRSNPNWNTNSTGGGLAFLQRPYYTPVDSLGKRNDIIPGGGFTHPAYYAENVSTIGTNTSIVGNFFVEIKLFKGMKFISRTGVDASDYSTDFLRKPSYKANGTSGGQRGLGTQQNAVLTTNNVLEYTFNIKKNHFTVLAGQEGISSDTRTKQNDVQGLVSNYFVQMANGTQSTMTASSSRTEFAFLSFFGRADYNMDNRFFLDASVRNDACSRFGAENRNAGFWSVGAMWNMTDESFIKNIQPITDLRLKVSYGTQGNAEIGNYDALPLTGSTTQYSQGLSWGITQPGNPRLTWEKQSKLTVGLRTELINKFRIEFDYYKRVTDAMLISVPYPFTSGISSLRENVGSLANNGIDLKLNMDFFRKKDYFASAYVIFNYNSEKVTKLFNNQPRWEIANTGVAWVVGSPIMFYYPIYAGVNPENGKQQWYVPGDNKDVTTKDENNKTETFSTALQQNTGIRRYAPISGGFGLSAGWKGFQVDADFSSVQGKYMIDNTWYFSHNPQQFALYNSSRDVMDYWTEDNKEAKFPNWKLGASQAMQFDTHILSNASFMRLKNLTASYSVPSSVMKKTKVLSNVRVFATGRNLWTITKYIGIDPEVDSNLALGTYGNSKQYECGIELTF